MGRQQRFQHKVGSSRSRPPALEGGAAFLLFMPCRPSLHRVERPHCICNMQASLSCFVTRPLSPTASPLRAAHSCFASTSLVPKSPILRDVAPDRHHDLDVALSAANKHCSVMAKGSKHGETIRSSLDLAPRTITTYHTTNFTLRRSQHFPQNNHIKTANSLAYRAARRPLVVVGKRSQHEADCLERQSLKWPCTDARIEGLARRRACRTCIRIHSPYAPRSFPVNEQLCFRSAACPRCHEIIASILN